MIPGGNFEIADARSLGHSASAVGRAMKFRHHERSQADADQTDHDELLELTSGQLWGLRRNVRCRFAFTVIPPTRTPFRFGGLRIVGHLAGVSGNRGGPIAGTPMGSNGGRSTERRRAPELIEHRGIRHGRSSQSDSLAEPPIADWDPISHPRTLMRRSIGGRRIARTVREIRIYRCEAGSTGSPFTLTPKWRCGPVLAPVLPIAADRRAGGDPLAAAETRGMQPAPTQG